MKKFICGLLAVVSLSANALAPQAPRHFYLNNAVVGDVIEEGKGKFPTEEDTVQVTYKGTFLDGTVFDESTTPINFPLKSVIPCWTTGLPMVREGATLRLECPSETAYGGRGAGDKIPPNTRLIFVIKLISINK